ncbi:hypothetical protein BAUCODRAFT_555133 [Baudoinia panamericana UAMH 10762]|uniref:Uncharacterized protein n=1 Tax=Baudoinia panamericana (strain UAMH 10762) TaxID=717646 RepID=M2LK82_BAUPA|nr:uncharacterized protein BAUCODRAFT_555133 [Baudoinia panamericana UAMH 10762]EMC94662.1 hypothetical protein BAUCODRAFT_555133 [Baudoinia panamericana UAMH 10762]
MYAHSQTSRPRIDLCQRTEFWTCFLHICHTKSQESRKRSLIVGRILFASSTTWSAITLIPSPLAARQPISQKRIQDRYVTHRKASNLQLTRLLW